MNADWCNRARARLSEMETLIRQGRGNERVAGGGCTDPGGGIVPTTPTAHEMAATLRKLLASGFGSCPPPTSPPPFGQPQGHIGGSYDWWWWNIGRSGGMPYNPDGRPHADLAKEEVHRRLNRPPWGRGIGITRLQHPAGVPYDAVMVMVQKPEHIALARMLVGEYTTPNNSRYERVNPDQLYGTPIVYEAVGDFVAAKPAAPDNFVGFGQGETLSAPAASSATSPWPIVLVTSVVGAATSWVIEEIARHTRKRYERRL